MMDKRGGEELEGSPGCSRTHEKKEKGLASAESMDGLPIAARKAECVGAHARGVGGDGGGGL